MDKAQALHSFWSSFGLDAYDMNTVPTGASMPYITYEVSTDSLDNVVNLTASIWYHSMSWAEITQKADEIALRLSAGGQTVKLDAGYLWITPGSPFAQRMDDPTDDAIRRIILNVQAEFLTAA
jgi:hypothetical protein